MSIYWNSASISALAAICGSLAGALGSWGAAWIAQRHEDRRELLAKKIFHREQLYSDFISETTNALADAVQHSFQDPSKLIPTYALLNRMRLNCSGEVIDSAERVVRMILDAYKQPNLTAPEIQEVAARRNDTLRGFSDISRHDLEALWKGLQHHKS